MDRIKQFLLSTIMVLTTSSIITVIITTILMVVLSICFDNYHSFEGNKCLFLIYIVLSSGIIISFLCFAFIFIWAIIEVTVDVIKS